MGGFNNPIIGGGGSLAYPAIHSPNFVTGSAGWTINKDGSAEFSDLTIRGGFWIVDSSGEFQYNGTPAANNLIFSNTDAAGTDSHGNAYLAGTVNYGVVSGTYYATQILQGEIFFYYGASQAGPWTLIVTLNAIVSPLALVIDPAAGGDVFVGAPFSHYALSALAAGSFSGSTAEKIIGTFSVPAGDPVAGSAYDFRAVANVNVAAATSVTIRVRANGLTGPQVMSTGALTSRLGSGLGCCVQGTIMIRDTGHADVWGTFTEKIVAATAALHPDLTLNTGIDTASAWTVVITAQFTSANAGNLAQGQDGALNRQSH